MDAPPNAPPVPSSNLSDTEWPGKWTAQVEAWSYGDFSNKTAVAKGKFFYDAGDEYIKDGVKVWLNGHSRAEWSPYINGKNATQVWIAGTGSAKSDYYVKSGLTCIYFPITDPGTSSKGSIGIEKPDWIQTCDNLGLASYVGRESVHIQTSSVWVDHWSCHLDYKAANQQITFQNWHSIGIDGIAKGLPLRVTGGNSAPNAQKGAPRLNTVWYTNHVVGPHAVKPADFEKPGKFCLPVYEDQVEAFFGHSVARGHVFSSDFHKRAHFLPHAKPHASDISRAKQPKPAAGSKFVGKSFEDATDKLNQHLRGEKGLSTRPCADFDLKELFEVQELLFAARAPSLDEVYSAASDTRRMAHGTLSELKQVQRANLHLVEQNPSLLEMVRDGICHESVMWYTHHVSKSGKEEVKQMLTLPLLPMHAQLHPKPSSGEKAATSAHQKYVAQASCAVCHVA